MLAGLKLGRLAGLGRTLAGCCCLRAWRARKRWSRCSVARLWLLLLAPPLPPVLLAGAVPEPERKLGPRGRTTRVRLGSPTLAPARASADGPNLASPVPFGPARSGGAVPGLICRAMRERDELLRSWRTPVGAVLRCAPLAAESAQGAQGRSPLQPGSPGAPALLVLVRYSPLAALPVGRIRA